MIQKAIVESIENNYQVKVRIPKYNKMANDGFSYNDLSTSIICSSPGTLVSYSVGDIVLVGFENNEIDKPVILGLLYTENNRGDSIDFPELSEALNSVTSSVQKLEKANSYIHIRYSNDNGVTFTSLYDYSDEKYDLETNKYYASNIVCNPESSFIIWNIVDNYGKNAVDKVYLSTNVAAIFPDGTEQVVVSTEPSFSLPDTFKFAQTVTAAYEMTILEGVKSDYNIALFTDKNECSRICEECRKGERGCVACKKELAKNISETLKPMREKRAYYESHPEEVDKILKEGTEKARKVAKETMEKIKKAMMLNYFEK